MDRLLELTHRAEQSHFWFRGFRWFMRPEIERAVAGIASPRLIDCGCGTGANVEWLQEFGEACGFDLTWNGLALGRRMGRRRLARASIAAIPFPDATFDVATSFDVLQCVPDAIEVQGLREMRRVLKPHGHLIVNVAALDVLSGGHAVLSQEVRRYTRDRLQRVVSAAGFAIERLTFVNASLFPLMLPVRVVQRWLRARPDEPGEFDITVPLAPVNAALTGLLALEAAALRRVNMPIGSSLLCHAVREG
jgi:SAM-dependent methyltransferase